MGTPIALCVSASAASNARQGRARNRLANPKLALGIKREGAEYVCCVTQQRAARARTRYCAVVMQTVIADGHRNTLPGTQAVAGATRRHGDTEGSSAEARSL